MKTWIWFCTLLAFAGTASAASGGASAGIVHDAEYYILDAQNGEK